MPHGKPNAVDGPRERLRAGKATAADLPALQRLDRAGELREGDAALLKAALKRGKPSEPHGGGHPPPPKPPKKGGGGTGRPPVTPPPPPTVPPVVVPPVPPVVAPPAPPPTALDRWWDIPGGNRSGNAWNIGVNSTGWAKDTVGTYEKTIRPLDAFCAGAHGGDRTKTWEGIIGGPLGFAGIAKGTQLDWKGGSGFADQLQCGVNGKTWHILNVITHPDGAALADLAKPGPHDGMWARMGERMRQGMAAAGLEPWQLVLRINKEMNQNGVLRPGQATAYAQAMGRFLTAVRQGYGDTGRGRLRATFSPARMAMVGPLDGFASFAPDGSCLYDAISCSTHPASQLNVLAGKSPDLQKAGVLEWLQGGYKDGYSYLNKDPNLSALVFARKHGLPMSMDEWSPRFETPQHGSGGGQDLHCAISAAAFEAIRDFLVQYADLIAWDCVFQANVLQESDAVCPGWAEGSRRYKRLWAGR